MEKSENGSLAKKGVLGVDPSQKAKKVHKSSQICFTGPRIEELLTKYPEEMYLERIQTVLDEMVAGFHFLRNYGLAATFFGSARTPQNHEMYLQAEKLAYDLSKKGFAIITGGGPGIMEAANKGASEAGGISAGLNIQLETEQRKNEYVKDSQAFTYFFTRKVMLAFASEVYVFFPGGFGTQDEFFEMATLVQTLKVEPIPIILVGKDYWKPLLSWIEKTMYKKYKAISEEDMELYHLAKDAKEAAKLIDTMVERGEQEKRT